MKLMHSRPLHHILNSYTFPLLTITKIRAYNIHESASTPTTHSPGHKSSMPTAAAFSPCPPYNAHHHQFQKQQTILTKSGKRALSLHPLQLCCGLNSITGTNFKQAFSTQCFKIPAMHCI